ncbi:hypothetical protein AB0I81_63425 [Nonomuraea sp. NPDC050404]
MSSLLERIAARRAELTEQAQHLAKQLCACRKFHPCSSSGV